MRKIAVVIGSDSDLLQCVAGLEYLDAAVERGVIEVVAVITSSIHRHSSMVLSLLASLSDLDAVIIGAGRANHITGTSDAFLRRLFSNLKTVVIGVAFEGGPNHPEWTQAAMLSVSEVPNTQVTWKDGQGQFVGSLGFYRACVLAADGSLPTIEVPDNKTQSHRRSLKEAIAVAKAAVSATLNKT